MKSYQSYMMNIGRLNRLEIHEKICKERAVKEQGVVKNVKAVAGN